MAFWYTKETSRLDGGFFGFTDQFTGLGIVIDTYDNDNTVCPQIFKSARIFLCLIFISLC